MTVAQLEALARGFPWGVFLKAADLLAEVAKPLGII